LHSIRLKYDIVLSRIAEYSSLQFRERITQDPRVKKLGIIEDLNKFNFTSKAGVNVYDGFSKQSQEK